MSEDKPPSRSSLSKIFDKLFPKTLKPRAQLMQALEEAEENLVIDPYSRSVIEGALQVESLKVRDVMVCLLYTSPSPRDRSLSRMPSSA